MLLLLGCGVVATAILKGSKGEGGGWLLINFGWGLAVFAGVYVAFRSGAHLNPAVTLGSPITGPTRRHRVVAGAALLGGGMVGAFIGAVIAWLAFKQHFDAEEDPGKKLAVFSTGPAIRSYGWNTVTEIIGTFVLVFVILMSGGQLVRALPDPSWAAVRRAAGRRYRRLPRWPDRVRDQPGSRPRPAHRARHAADQGQGRLGLGLLLGAGRRPADRRRARRASPSWRSAAPACSPASPDPVHSEVGRSPAGRSIAAPAARSRRL